MSDHNSSRRRNGVRGRAPKACKRCRDLKIKCNGGEPCSACDKRSYSCHYESESEKVMVTRRYISDLQQRISSLERKVIQSRDVNTAIEQSAILDPELEPSITVETSHNQFASTQPAPTREQNLATTVDESVQLINPLAYHSYNWVPLPLPRTGHMFMGTSSNWAFGRRVLNMTSTRLLGHPLPPAGLLFDSIVYDLKWDGNRFLLNESPLDLTILPTRDHAAYLIQSVKFHCCRLYYLFDEELFMKQFEQFHDNPSSFVRDSPLWYTHYLLLLAFGKAFVTRSAKSGQPPGADLFLQAMKCKPDFTFLIADGIQRMQVLCCIALYLQCLSCRTAAHRAIDQALRIGLEHGMHTDMNDPHLDEAYVQRCRTMWWTVYVLERQMSSFMGVPGGIAEESVNTPFPMFPGQPQKRLGVEIQGKLCQVLAKIDRTVYGVEGKLGSKYLSATQSVLRSIADVTEQLNTSLNLHVSDGMEASSRIAASLHLLQHQCIIMTTRPLLYIFLQSKLNLSDDGLMLLLHSSSVRGLLQICVESAQQSLRVLSLQLDQDSLAVETFLPFDLEVTFTSTTSLLMAAAIDSSLLADIVPWTDKAYKILTEMCYRENAAARMHKSELQTLQAQLEQLLAERTRPSNTTSTEAHAGRQRAESVDLAASSTAYIQPWGLDTTDQIDWNYELSAEQLINIADTLDMDSLAWPSLDIDS